MDGTRGTEIALSISMRWLKSILRQKSVHSLFWALPLIVISPSLSQARIRCEQVLSLPPVIARNSKLDQAVLSKRSRSVKKTKIRQIPVKGVTYEVLGLLGEGSSAVYLARSPEGARVTIKHLRQTEGRKPDWINSIYYEVAVTRYYLSRGLMVPRIVAFEVKKDGDRPLEGFLVKEYREGLTWDEFSEARGLSFLFGSKYQTMQEALDREIQSLQEIHEGFRAWLSDQNIDLHEHRFKNLDWLIDHGDHSGFGTQNWLFDIETYRWVLFDP